MFNSIKNAFTSKNEEVVTTTSSVSSAEMSAEQVLTVMKMTVRNEAVTGEEKLDTLERLASLVSFSGVTGRPATTPVELALKLIPYKLESARADSSLVNSRFNEVVYFIKSH